MKSSLQFRHNERDGVSNHRCLDCLLNRSLRRRSKKDSASLTYAGGIHRWPHKGLRGKCFHLMASPWCKICLKLCIVFIGSGDGWMSKERQVIAWKMKKKLYDIIVASLAGNRLITYIIIIFYHLTIYCNTHSDALWQCVVTRLPDSFDLRHFDTETHFPSSHSWYSWYQAAFHNLVEEPWTRYFNKRRPDFSAVEIRSWRKEFSLSMHCVIFCTFIFQQYIVSINTFA